MPESGDELEARWAAWLLARNRRATLILLSFNAVLYPMFGVLDYYLAPREWLWLLWATRVFVSLVTLGMFAVVRRPFFERHASVLSAGYQVIASGGVSLMTIFFGGLASPYYAGLSLGMFGVALLFVWPRAVVIVTHSTIVASFVLPNWILNHSADGVAIVSNLFFLASAAFIAGTGQLVAYRTHREQLANQLLVESTKAALQRAHTQLQQLDRFKSEFFANITHELKTPLTMILAPLELMIDGQMGKVTEIQRTSLRSMLKSGVKLLKLIGDLLDLSKLNESRLRLQIAEHDLVSYLADLTAQVQSLTQRKSIVLGFESNVQECLVFCDLEKLERVFINLLSNASKFTPIEGKVRVRLEDEGERVRISVIDNGIGFPPEMADALFERFFQVDMAGTRKFAGTGIGLSLARELVHLHGGRISAESASTGGATFTVELPKDKDHFEPEQIDRRARREDIVAGLRESDHGLSEWEVEAKSQFRLIDIDEATDQRVVGRDPDEHQRTASVLVVDDTPDVIRVIHLALRSHFRILAAPGGQKGFELATKHLPSVIITDLMMPDMDGRELTRMLRDDPRTRHIPVVMLTARGDVEDRVAGMESGVNAYLSKPFSTRELVSTVRGLVRIQETTADLVMTHNMDSLETVAGGLAHEINNPLNYIKNAFSLIQSDARALLERVEQAKGESHAAEGSELTAVVRDTTIRMDRMFGVADTGLRRIGATVTLMQRYSREGYTRVLQPLNAFEAAHDVVALLQTGLASPVVDVSFQGDGRLYCVPEEFNQVLTNLVQNALDAMPHDGSGKVSVRGWSDDALLVLSVTDNGPGIRPEERAKIFTPFYTTKEIGKGMGLGLTIVHRVVTSLRGTVEILNPASGGTEFTLRIPRQTRESSPSPPVSYAGFNDHGEASHAPRHEKVAATKRA